MFQTVKRHFNYRPHESEVWDWHKWLHLRWWKYWLLTEKCDGCGYGRRFYSLTEVFCIFCMTSNFGLRY